jgi:hypothetical protein
MKIDYNSGIRLFLNCLHRILDASRAHACMFCEFFGLSECETSCGHLREIQLDSLQTERRSVLSCKTGRY